MESKMMPVHPDDRKLPDCPKAVPMSILNEDLARYNHNQTLDRLAERGGLGAVEILANMDRMNLRDANSKWKDADAIQELNRRLLVLNKSNAGPFVDWLDCEIAYNKNMATLAPSGNGSVFDARARILLEARTKYLFFQNEKKNVSTPSPKEDKI